MSRIIFKSLYDEAEVNGAERFWMGNCCDNLFKATLGVHSYWTKTLEKIIPKDSWVFDENNTLSRSKDLALYFGTMSSDHKVLYKDEWYTDFFSISLNTALQAGSDVVKLMAMIHGLCELHCYVEARNKQWLANIIKKGRKQSILRPNEGWESVCALLETPDDSPIVLSYSVCDEFPGINEIKTTNAWYDLPYEKQFKRAINKLRKNKRWLELNPKTWDDYYFSNGLTAFDLIHQFIEEDAEEEEVIK
jgi:hypothetical protein